MRLHQIDVNHRITQKSAKALAQILISVKGIKTPVVVKVVSSSIEYTVFLE